MKPQGEGLAVADLTVNFPGAEVKNRVIAYSAEPNASLADRQCRGCGVCTEEAISFNESPGVC